MVLVKTSQYRGRSKDRRGQQAEHKWRNEEQEDIRGQPPSYTASHGIRIKEGYTEIEKHKSPEAKGSWNNLRKD